MAVMCNVLIKPNTPELRDEIVKVLLSTSIYRKRNLTKLVSVKRLNNQTITTNFLVDIIETSETNLTIDHIVGDN